jgi:uncharacterized membrane protein YgcG
MAVLALLLIVTLAGGTVGAQTEGDWRIDTFTADIAILEDGLVEVEAVVVANFGTLRKHGIFYEFVVRQPCGEVEDEGQLYECPRGSDREYRVRIESVQAADGGPVRYETSREGRYLLLRIGDPDRTVTGVQTYRLRYTIEGALNAFADGDEFFWNITGTWPVPIQQFEARVVLPEAGRVEAICFEGYRSQAQCAAAASGNTATYRATRVLHPGEEVTIAARWQKGAVNVPPPLLVDRTSIDDFFTFDVVEFIGAGLLAMLGLLAVARTWWLHGRDRRYTTIHYLTNDPTEETKPFFGKHPVVIEYLPPEGLRPAQMGVLLDERADTLDVTATIVDLAVRGYLRITEIPKQGWFGKTDWELEQLRAPDEELLPYEKKLQTALFKGRQTVKVSALKEKFYKDLEAVKKDLYRDSVARKWFSVSPDSARQNWMLIGFGVTALAVAITAGSGYFLGRALLTSPLILAGLGVLLLAPAMSRRTAVGSEAKRRILGFRLYVDTAEKRLHEFHEEKNIFARYLPYAIVFESVDKWAKAFEGMDDVAKESTSSWYRSSSGRPFRVGAFAAGLGSFSSSMSSSISSTPGGSGGSGFSGGGRSGGGGGGGRGGSW